VRFKFDHFTEMIPSRKQFFNGIIESDAEILEQSKKHLKNTAYLGNADLAVKLWNKTNLAVESRPKLVLGSDSRPSLDQYLEINQHLQVLLLKSSVHATVPARFEGTGLVSMAKTYFEAEWDGQKVSGVGFRGLLFAVCKSVLFRPSCESSDCGRDLLGDDFDYEVIAHHCQNCSHTVHSVSHCRLTKKGTCGFLIAT